MEGFITFTIIGLLLHMKRPLEQAGIDLFIDNFVLTGEYDLKIKTAVNRATAAVLFISPHFLDSDYIIDKELPILISRYKAKQLDFFPLYLSPCTWDIVRIAYPDPGNNNKKAYFLLSGLSCPDHDPKNPLDRESDSKVNEVFSRITQRLLTYHAERKKKMQAGQKSGNKKEETDKQIHKSTIIVPGKQPGKSTTIAVKINGPSKSTPTKTTTIVEQTPSWATYSGVDQYGRYADFTIKGITQRMRWIEPGEFHIGSPPDEPERGEDEHQHRVVLTQGYWLADTACTQNLWRAVLKKNPLRIEGKNLPVENVSWKMAQKFITQCNLLIPGLCLRLPTEAEWEYACRVGTTTPFSFGETISINQVNYNGDYPYQNGKKGKYRKTTVNVTSFPCNARGLYQMHGNVWEWCADWYNKDYYKHSPINDPPGPEKGNYRVSRGGSWCSDARLTRSANRNGFTLSIRDGGSVGFRLARNHQEISSQGTAIQ